MESLHVIMLCLFLMGLVATISVAYDVSGIPVSAEVDTGAVDHISHDVLDFAWLDSSNRIVMDGFGNVRATEQGVVIGTVDISAGWVPLPGWDNVCWSNDSGVFPLHQSDVFMDKVGVGSGGDEYWTPMAVHAQGGGVVEAFVNSLLSGLDGLIIGIMATVVVISLEIFGSGLNWFGTRAILTVAFFGMVWALVSSVAFDALTSIPFFGWMVFGFMSFVYFFALWGQVNAGGVQ